MNQSSWCDSASDISLLTKFNVAYTPCTITASEIDAATSLINGARWTAKVPDAIDRYILAMKRGDAFPRLIVVKKPAGYVILNGNQRFSAIQMLINEGFYEHDVQIGVYAIAPDTDSLTLDCILKSANETNGVASTYDERLAHAVALVRDKGVTIKEAANIHLVSTSTISAMIAADEERSFLAKNGVRTETLARASLQSIARLGPDESSKIRIAKLAVLQGLKSDDVKAAVSKVLDAKSLAERQSVIKSIEAESHRQNDALQQSAPGSLTPKRNRRDKFIRALDSLVTFLEAGNNGTPMASIDDLQLSGKSDLSRSKELSVRLVSRLSKIGVYQS